MKIEKMYKVTVYGTDYIMTEQELHEFIDRNNSKEPAMTGTRRIDTIKYNTGIEQKVRR